MCGIFGVLMKEEGRNISPDWLTEITDTMYHRGPDDCGVYIRKNVGLGHRRLSIIDLSGGKQPIYNEDGTIAIVFNGEIYNYMELRRELLKKDHRFSTNTDTEVIVHAYEEFGDNCSSYLRGMFSFAIFDERKRKLYISRDRLGIKPMYYFDGKEAFLFSSEVKALYKTNLLAPELNTDALDFYLTLGHVPGPQTMFRNVYKLPPGHWMSIELGKAKIKKYWFLEKVVPFKGTYHDAEDRLQELLEECVSSHLMSEVPLGVFLSGGLDSSSMVAVMSKLGNSSIKTFTVGYKDACDISELEFARIVADKFCCEHFEFILTPDNFFETIQQVLEFTEEPICESAAIALYKLAKLARSEAIVLLSGEGADEVFAGYPLYWKMPKINLLRKLLKQLPYDVLKLFLNNNILSEKSNKYIDWILSPNDFMYQTVSTELTSSLRKKMYSDELLNYNKKGISSFFKEIQQDLNSSNYLDIMQYSDIKTWLPDSLLLKADKMTMAASVELRVPFLDYKMVEFGYSLPVEYKVRKNEGKYILKKVMEKYLPKTIIHRKKRGFPVPISKWFSKDIFKLTEEVLLDRKTTNRGYFRNKYIEKLLNDHKNNKSDMSIRIFSLLNLELWHRKYIDKSN